MPVFEKAAKVLSNTQNLLFTTINMGLNELEDHVVYYYPTVRFYPKDSKYRPYDYDQGLDLNDVIKFVKRVAAVKPIVEDYSVLLEETNTPNQQLNDAQNLINGHPAPSNLNHQGLNSHEPRLEDL